MKKAIVLVKNRKSNIKLIEYLAKQTASVDCIVFSVIGELPVISNENTYTGAIIVTDRIGESLWKYIRMIRDNNFHQSIYLLGTPKSPAIYKRFEQFEGLLLMAVSENLYDQIKYLISKLVNTRQKQAGSGNTSVKHEISDSGNHFKALVENALDGIYQSTPEGKIIYANQALIRMLGYDSFEEMQKLHIAGDVYNSTEERQNFKRLIKEQGTVNNYYINLRRKDGTIIRVSEHAQLVRRPDGSFLYEGVIRDITKYLELQKSLKYSQTYLSDLIENADIMIDAFDAEDNIVIWNRKAEEITGYRKEDVFGDKNFLRKLYPDNDYYEMVMEKSDLELKKLGPQPLEFVLTTKTGEEKYIKWTSMHIDTERYGTLNVGFGVDLTETKRLRKKLLQVRRNELKGDLANRFIRILEKNITQCLHAIRDNLDQTDQANFIEGRLKPMQKISQWLMEINQDQEVIKTHDINKHIQTVSDLISHILSQQIDFKQYLHADSMIEAASGDIYSLLINLLLNALEMMPVGGDLIISSASVKTNDIARLRPLQPENNAFVQITLNDTGVGLSEKDKKLLFEPQAGGCDNMDSSGCGLSVARRITDKYNGYIFVDSKIGHGTQVDVFLPEAASNARDEESAEKHQTANIKDGTVLVVDDEVVIRDLMYDVLSDKGYSVYTASDGVEGIKIFNEHPDKIDLVILDIIMPNMDGKEMFDQIKAINKDVKIIVISGFSKPKVKESLQKSGVDGFIAKPFNIADMLVQIEQLLS